MAEEKKEAAPAKPKNMGLILQIAFAAVNLAGTGFGAYLVYASTLGWNPPRITEESLGLENEKFHPEEMAPFIYTMDKFTVNLDGEPKKTIRIEVNLEMLSHDGFEEVINTENRAKARDKIVRILNEKGFSDLESIQGKLFLKERIAMEVNSLLRKGVIKDVFFSDFVIQ